MKKFICLLLVIVMTFSFSACTGGNTTSQVAFTSAQTTYGNLMSAYEKIDAIGSDIYEAWRIGVYETPSISKLDEKLNLSYEELNAAAEVLGAGMIAYHNVGDSVFYLFGDVSKFSICVELVEEAYKLKGTYEEIDNLLASAKSEMKAMSEQYSDYEHYDNLKKMYSIVDSYAEFCKDPTGSFDQLTETINDYRNDIRDLESDLGYIFEDF